jgi:hypothetical protein
MPLSLFHHDRFAHYRSTNKRLSTYDHTFGGDANSYGLRFVNVGSPLHLIYRLDQSDPAIPIQLDEVRSIPLVYGFRYAAFDGTLICRVLNDVEIEVLAPTELTYDPDFPYPGHPEQFPLTPIAFTQLPFDPARAEDALSLQAIFGLDKLSRSELQRAIKIGLSNSSYVCYSRDDLPDPGWTDEDILRCLGRAPFIQGAPSRSCANPDCTAEIVGHVDGMELDLTDISPDDKMAKQAAAFGWDLGEVVREYFGTDKLEFEGHDVRADTMRVIGIHQPDPGDRLMWGDPYVQLVFEFCDCCHCIRVSNQCT